MTTAPEQRLLRPGLVRGHGTPQCYRHGCRRPECIAAKTADVRKWKYLRDTGRSGFVPAEKVIARIWRLRAAGMTDVEIRAAARLSPPHLYQIIRTKAPVLHTTAARIFAVPIPEHTGEPTRNGAMVPRLGTRRRLQVLNAHGWPAIELGRRIGCGTGYLGYILRGCGNDTVRLCTAEAIRALYDQIAGQQPEDHGVPSHVAKQTRARAAAKGWAGTDYWDPDDFDNPDFVPATSETPRYVVLAENGLEYESQGFTREQAAELLGVSKDNLQQSIGRYRKAQELEAAA